MWMRGFAVFGTPVFAEKSRIVPPLLGDLLRPRRRTLAILVAAMLVQMAASLAAPWPLKIIIDDVVGNHRPPGWIRLLLPILGGSDRAHVAEAAGLVIVLIAVATGAAMYVTSYFTETLGQHVGIDLRVRLYHQLQQLSLAYYDTNRVGTILSTLTSDVQTIQGFASASTLNVFTNTLTLVGMVVVMVLCRWDFALIAIAITPLLGIFILRVNKMIRTAVKEVRTRQSDLLATLQEGLQSIQVVQAFGREEHQEQRLHEAGMDTATAWLRARRVSSLLSPAHPVRCDDPRRADRVPHLRGQVLPTGARPRPEPTPSRRSRWPSSESHRSVTPTRSSPNTPNRPNRRRFSGEITFEHVAFGYDPAVPVLRDVTFTIRPGEMVGIVGPTGSGKSTIVSLIPRFRDLDAGSIKIDGVDIRHYKLRELRSQIGFVLQDTVLLRGTVRDNIAFGRPDATDDEIVEAAKMANAHAFITRMPEGYDSQIGDRGMTLSGGQRQRIGIARALIRNNPILILDEPTAALDAESERLVTEALERLMKGRTVITIAHRLSTLRSADKIIVVRDGEVAEDGTHDQLLAFDGLYAQLRRLQYQTLDGSLSV
jgi:subfamily B ATP-binding cassette protein MsbA